MVEIEILSACSHEHIVGLLETYLFNSKLWVSHWFVQVLKIFNKKVIFYTRHVHIVTIKLQEIAFIVQFAVCAVLSVFARENTKTENDPLVSTRS